MSTCTVSYSQQGNSTFNVFAFAQSDCHADGCNKCVPDLLDCRPRCFCHTYSTRVVYGVFKTTLRTGGEERGTGTTALTTLTETPAQRKNRGFLRRIFSRPSPDFQVTKTVVEPKLLQAPAHDHSEPWVRHYELHMPCTWCTQAFVSLISPSTLLP